MKKKKKLNPIILILGVVAIFLFWKGGFLGALINADVMTIDLTTRPTGDPDGHTFFMHPREGLFFTTNNDLKWDTGLKGGMGPIMSPQYGYVRGWQPDHGGGTQRATWHPNWYSVEYDGGYQNVNSVLEVTYLKEAVIMKSVVTCMNPAGCIGLGGARYKTNVWEDRGTSGTNVVYGTYGGAYGFKTTISGTGWDYPSFTKDWYMLVRDQPTSHAEAGVEGKVYYDLTYGEEKELMLIITIEDHLAEVNDFFTNYDTHKTNTEQDFVDYVNGFDTPSGDSLLYYRAIYGIYGNIFPAGGYMNHQFATPNIAGHLFNPVRGIDGGSSNYMGQWVWDSSFASLGLVTACNPGNACWDDLTAMQLNWDENTVEDGSTHWCREIHPDGDGITSCSSNSINPPGLWSMISLKKYLVDGDQTALCNIYPNLKSNNDWIKANRDSDGDHLFWAMSGEMGRDGSDMYVNTNLQPGMTGWYMLDALMLSKIASVCNPSDVAYYESEYALTGTAYESAFYNPTYQTYDYLRNDKTHVVVDGVPNAIPLSLGFASLFNTHGGTKDEIILNELLTNYADTYFPTSIPTNHVCYTPTGSTSDQATNPACKYGATWDGPVWPQDEFIMNEMFIQMKARGVTGASTEHSIFKQQTIDLYNTLPFPAESYDSETGYSALWGAFPHSANSGFILYLLSGEQMIDPDIVIEPPVEVCGNNICEAGETEVSCPADCEVQGDVCGNNICESSETAVSCPADCEAPVVTGCDDFTTTEECIAWFVDELASSQNTISQQAVTIAELNLDIVDQAALIDGLELTISQQAALIDELDLTLEEKAILIANLEISNAEKAAIIDSLTLTVGEKNELITLLESADVETAPIPWLYIGIGAAVLIVIMSMRRRER